MNIVEIGGISWLYGNAYMPLYAIWSGIIKNKVRSNFVKKSFLDCKSRRRYYHFSDKMCVVLFCSKFVDRRLWRIRRQSGWNLWVSCLVAAAHCVRDPGLFAGQILCPYSVAAARQCRDGLTRLQFVRRDSLSRRRNSQRAPSYPREQGQVKDIIILFIFNKTSMSQIQTFKVKGCTWSRLEGYFVLHFFLSIFLFKFSVIIPSHLPR